MTEFELIDRFFRRPGRHTVLGVGDDAALLVPNEGSQLAVSVDMLVEGRHFFADVDPEKLGHKTLAVNLSDMAAMGATPRWALLAGALPRADEEWLRSFVRGFFALADEYEVDLVGGDTTRGPLNLCVTVLGEVPVRQELRRSGARAGDSIWVSGVLGDAALALAHRLGRLKLGGADLVDCERALLLPSPRVALGLSLRGVASAAIDISDGLTGDLGHILEASEVGASIEFDAVPRSPAMTRQLRSDESAIAMSCLLAGGDDYELCFTTPSQQADKVSALSDALGLGLTRIGHVTATPGLIVRVDGKPMDSFPRGFDHFGPAAPGQLACAHEAK